MNSRTWYRAGTAAVAAGTALTVLLALSMTAARVLVNQVPELRGEAEQRLSRLLQRPVSVGALEARLSGFSPTIVLEQVRLAAHEGAAPLAADGLAIRFDPWASLWHRELRIAALTLNRPALTLVRDRAGGLRFQEGSGPGGGPALPVEVQVAAGRITIEDHLGERSFVLEQVDARFRRQADRYQLALEFQPAETLARRVAFRADWQGAIDQLPTGSGRLYLKAEGARLKSLAALLPERHRPALDGGTGALELWLTLDRGRPVRAAGELALEDLQAGAAASLPVRLAGRFDWQAGAEGWRLDVDRLEGAGAGDSRTRVSLVRNSGPAGERWRAGAGELALDPLSALLKRLPPALAQGLPRPLPGVSGRLRALSLDLLRGAGPARYRVQADFADLALAGYGLPELAGLSGSLLATERGGQARLRGEQVRLHWPDLFRAPLDFQQLVMRDASWWRDPASGALRLAVPELAVRDGDTRLRGRGRWHRDAAGRDLLSLRATLADGDAARVPDYLPAHLLRPQLVGWLDQAFPGGRVESAAVLFHGRPADFPFRRGEGVFDVQARVAGLTLAYQPGWPPVRQLDGRLRFRNQRMDIQVQRGRVYGAQVRRMEAHIPDLMRAELALQGTLAGPGADMLRFLRDSPLLHRNSRLLDGVSLSGRPVLNLDLMVPFSGAETRVEGRLVLDGSALEARQLGLRVSDLQGTVGFDRRGLEAQRLRGRFAGRPAEFRIATGQDAGVARIFVEGHVVAGLDDLGDPRLGARFPGAAPWLVQVEAPAFEDSDGRTRVHLATRLDGIAVDLPPPLAKPADEPRDLAVSFPVSDGRLGVVDIHYGTDIRGLAAVGETGGLRRLALHFGPGEPVLPEKPGIGLSGRLERFDLGSLAWGGDGGPGAQENGVPELRRVDLSVGELRAGQTLARELSLQGERGPQEWRLSIGGEGHAGQLRIPLGGGGEPVHGRFQRLDLVGLPSAGRERGGARGAATVPDWPPVDITVERLDWRGRDIGRLRAQVVRTAEGRRLEQLELDHELLRLRASGGWRQRPEGTTSRINLELASTDSGAALALFGYPGVLAGGQASGEARLSWPGGPGDLDPGRLDGELDFTLLDGAIPELEPGAGRMLGMLSVARLPRRLLGDFSELTSEGLAYDRFQGSFRLEDGVARTDVMVLEGPSARLDFDGSVDLAAEALDMSVAVTPRLSVTLPLIGGLAGGPVGALAALATQALLGGGINAVTRVRYQITGDWDDPTVERRSAERPAGNGGDLDLEIR